MSSAERCLPALDSLRAAANLSSRRCTTHWVVIEGRRVDDGQMGSDDERASALDRDMARQTEGNTFAESLAGLDREDAVSRTRERGFDPVVVPHTVEQITLDLRVNRIRLFLNETGTVVRASAG